MSAKEPFGTICPWPEDIFTTKLEDVGKRMGEVLSPNDVTAYSGTLMRHGWQLALKDVQEQFSGITDPVEFVAAARELADLMEKVNDLYPTEALTKALARFDAAGKEKQDE